MAVFIGNCIWVLAMDMAEEAGRFLEKSQISQLVFLVTGGLIGLAAGIFHAIKVAKVDPVESLRYE